MEKPTFLNIDPELIKTQVKEDYEQMTGRVLQPGQVEQLLINAFAYREYLIRTKIQDAATLNLVAFSRAPFLDHLGLLVGVRRLTASFAVCTLEMILVQGHGDLTIPMGIRVQSIDGQSVFSLDQDVNVSSSVNTVEARFTCLTPGTVGNNYNVNDISVILDPQPYLISATNIEVSTGGADEENDDELRERIMLAPQSFSNAGSRGAYDFYARSANAGIVDVSIDSPIPGQVNIYPLMENGVLPNQAVLDEVEEVCNDEKIRPLTDTVIVSAPTEITYSIDVTLTLITGYVSSEIQDEVLKNLTAYADSRKERIGLDVVVDQIIANCMQVKGVYEVNVITPASTIVANSDEVCKYTGINVTIGGYSDE